MQEEEAGPPGVVGGGAAAPSEGAAPRMPRDVPSVCVLVRAPVAPRAASRSATPICKGRSHPSHEARLCGVACLCESVDGSALDALVVSRGEEEYEDNVNIS